MRRPSGFGTSVALSDGNTALVGGDLDRPKPIPNSLPGSGVGAAWVSTNAHTAPLSCRAATPLHEARTHTLAPGAVEACGRRRIGFAVSGEAVTSMLGSVLPLSETAEKSASRAGDAWIGAQLPYRIEAKQQPSCNSGRCRIGLHASTLAARVTLLHPTGNSEVGGRIRAPV